MMKKIFIAMCAISMVLPFAVCAKTAAEKGGQEIYKLSYIEREPGTDDYEVTMQVSKRYIRIDDSEEGSGYILYDDKQRVIYSVGHHDHSVLVIKEFKFSEKNSPVNAEVEYLPLADAPNVSGKQVYNYRVFVTDNSAANIATNDNNNDEITCMELQLVEDILPEVRSILKRYQHVVASQQVKMTDNTVSEMQSACYFVDQIYNTGKYYDKGLPIQEWHSNERFKALTSYKKVTVSDDVFTIPQDYKKFSIGPDSKTFIK